MNKEFHISAGAVRVTLITALLYLLIPCILFLWGWCLPFYSIPAIILLIAGGVYVIRNSFIRIAPVQFSSKDIVAFIISLLLILFVLESTGFNGHTLQTDDFVVRNPVYESLIRDAWPIYNENGCLFVYYHSFWLVPALIAKSATFADKSTILFIWCFLGLFLANILLFYRLKSRILIFITAFLFLGLFSDIYFALVKLHISVPSPGSLVKSIVDARINSLCGFRQITYTFNHAIPLIIFASFLFCARVSISGILYVVALLTACTPFGAVAWLPVLLLLFLKDFRKQPAYVGKQVIIVTASCSGFLALLALYYIQGPGSDARIILFGYSSLKDALISLIPIFLCFIQFAILLFIFIGKFKRTHIPYAIFSIAIFLYFVHIGVDNNELLYKGFQFFSLYFALLIAMNWPKKKTIYNKVFILFVIFITSERTMTDIVHRVIPNYTWNEQNMKANIRDSWHGTLYHPDHFWSDRFWSPKPYDGSILKINSKKAVDSIQENS